MGTQLRGENRRASPGRVGMKPETFLAAERGDFGQWIDRSNRGRSGGANHQERGKAVLPILRNLPGEIFDVEPQVAVGGHRAQRSAAKPGYVGDLAEGMMRLFRQIKRGLPRERSNPAVTELRKGMGKGDDHRGKVRFRPAAGKRRTRLWREPKFGGEPAKRVLFDFIRRRRRAPARQLRVVHGDERVGNYGSKGDVGIEQPEVAGMGHLHLPCAQHVLDVGDNLFKRNGFAKIVADRKVAADLLRCHSGNDRSLPDLSLQLLEIALELIDDHSFPYWRR